jgi:two-component system LytT family response regulator
MFERSQQERRIDGGGWIPAGSVTSAPPPGASLGSISRRLLRLRTVLVDPDPAARHRLRGLLAGWSDIRLVGESGNGRDALDLIRRETPDLVFLEVHLPELNGLHVARSLKGEVSGGLVFVTDSEEYAVQAFEVHAIDYLVKPVHPDRLERAVAHARSIVRTRRDSWAQERLVALLDHRDAERQRRARLLIRRSEGAFFLKTDSIDWIEAAGKRVRVHTGKRVFEQRTALVRIEQGLNPDQFVRISRSAIVNVERIREIQTWFNGDYLVILDDGSQVPSSRRYRPNLQRLFGREDD